MNRLLLILICLASLCVTPTFAADFVPTAQDTIVPADSKLEMLWAEGDFTEGPALAPDGSIVFSDIGNTIHRFDPKTKKVAVFREKSGRANGLMYTKDGRLVACEGANTSGGRRISITEKNGTVKTLSDNFGGKKFNSPNDLAIAPSGDVYFTDPRYVGDDPRELDFEGVFLVKPDGKTTVATRDVLKPNGILVAADGKHAYVADNDPRPEKVRALLSFQVEPDGALSEREELFDFGDGRGIDGMTLDTDGNIYATAGSGDKAGIYVFSPGGKQLAFIKTPGDPTNCVFGGGTEASVLYITAAAPAKAGQPQKYALYRIPLKTKGYHVVQLAP